VTDFRYAATDLITGALLADTIPALNVESFSQQLNGGGSLNGQLDLSAVYQNNAPFLAALECRRSVLWVLADNYPVWNGVVWDWPDMSRQEGTLPITAQTLDSVFNYRLITASLEYAAVDIYGVFIDLINYGTTKSSPYIESISPIQGPASPLVAAAAAVAGLILPSGESAVSGQDWTASYLWSDLGQVSAAVQDLVTSGNLEFVFQPGLTQDGQLATYVYLSLDGLGRSYQSAGYSVVYPGNASDYGYQRTGSQSSNYIWASAPPNGSAEQWESQYPHGVDVADLEAGYPLMESTVQWQGSVVTEQSQVDNYADGQMALQTQAMTMPVINVPDGLIPNLRNLVLGDVFDFVATSQIHPPTSTGAPGYQGPVRLTGWTMYPPGPQQAAYVQLATSALVDIP
jgi:hypothetical protein